MKIDNFTVKGLPRDFDKNSQIVDVRLQNDTEKIKISLSVTRKNSTYFRLLYLMQACSQGDTVSSKDQFQDN